MELKITKMELSDLEEISNILISDFDDFWNYNILKNELLNPNSQYLVAKINDEIVGFAGFTIILDEADITNIVIKKSFRNKKIGTALLDELIKLATTINLKTITLEVAESNTPAINLYTRFNFEKCGLRKKYYNNVENAIIMTKKIN